MYCNTMTPVFVHRLEPTRTRVSFKRSRKDVLKSFRQNFLGENAKVRARLTYLDDDLRVVRNEKDGQVFAYIKA